MGRALELHLSDSQRPEKRRNIRQSVIGKNAVVSWEPRQEGNKPDSPLLSPRNSPSGNDGTLNGKKMTTQ